LLLVGLLLLTIIAKISADQLIERKKAYLLNTATFISSVLKENRKLPTNKFSDSNIYVIEESSGKYIVPKEFDSNDKGWLKYKGKIIFEMRNTRRGWITYPENKLSAFLKGYRIICYIPVDELRYILAVETSIKSIFYYIKYFITLRMILFILLVLAFSFLFMNIVTRHKIALLEELIENSQQKNKLKEKAKAEDTLETKEKLVEPENKPEKEDFESFVIPKDEQTQFSGNNSEATEPTILDKIQEELVINQEKESLFNLEKPDLIKSIPENSVKNPSTIIGKAIFRDPVNKGKKTEEAELEPLDENKEIEKIRIEVQGEESSLLKKMLKEMKDT